MAHTVLIPRQVVHEIVRRWDVRTGVEMVAMVHGAENFTGSVGEAFLEMLTEAPRGEVRELVRRSRNDSVLRPDCALRVERGKCRKRDTRKQYDEGPAETERRRGAHVPTTWNPLSCRTTAHTVRKL
jgi:acyl-CoA synthetase (AMP-forming)/AMP-acid ligase II